LFLHLPLHAWLFLSGHMATVRTVRHRRSITPAPKRLFWPPLRPQACTAHDSHRNDRCDALRARGTPGEARQTHPVRGDQSGKVMHELVLGTLEELK
jgi:hypothetical protein